MKLTKEQMIYLANRLKQISINKQREGEILKNKEASDEGIYLMVCARYYLHGLNEELPLEFKQYLNVFKLNQGD
jgi:hypothetical protein